MVGRAIVAARDEREPGGPEWVSRRIAVDNPIAGGTWSLKAPGEFEWRMLAVNSLFATSAVVATRRPYLRLRDATREIIRVPLGATYAASANAYMQWMRDVGTLLGGTADGMVLAPLPPLPFEPGFTLDWLCTNIDATDSVTLITVTVLERFTGERRSRAGRGLGLVEPLDFDARLAP